MWRTQLIWSFFKDIKRLARVSLEENCVLDCREKCSSWFSFVIWTEDLFVRGLICFNSTHLLSLVFWGKRSRTPFLVSTFGIKFGKLNDFANANTNSPIRFWILGRVRHELRAVEFLIEWKRKHLGMFLDEIINYGRIFRMFNILNFFLDFRPSFFSEWQFYNFIYFTWQMSDH